jgi:hypothetical protein
MNTTFDKILNPGKPVRLLLVVIYCYCLFLIGSFAYRHPHYNWDMLAYMALVIQEDRSDSKQIHEITYKTAKENIPASDFKKLLEGDYRKKLAEDPEAFFNTLPFYAVKPMYTKMVSLFHKAGFSLPISTILPSIIFYLLTGLLLCFWLLKYLEITWALAACLLIMLSGFMVSMAGLSTPDCLSAFLLLSSFYFILEKPSLQWVFFFFILSMFARLDNIVPCFFILSFLFFTGKWQKKIKLKYYLLMLIILTACYFGITFITMKPFGWDIFYYPTYSRYLNLSYTFSSSFSISDYLALAFSHVTTAILFYHFTLFMFFLLLILYSPSFKYRNFTLDQSFSVLLLLIMFVRFVLYPDLSDRFNIAYYLCFLMIFIKKYAGVLKGLKPLPVAVD